MNYMNIMKQNNDRKSPTHGSIVLRTSDNNTAQDESLLSKHSLFLLIDKNEKQEQQSDDNPGVENEPKGLLIQNNSNEGKSSKLSQELDGVFPDGYSEIPINDLRQLRDELNNLFINTTSHVNQSTTMSSDRIQLTKPMKATRSPSSTSSDRISQRIRQSTHLSAMSPMATEDELRRFELFRSVITHEDDLLNQRVSWIILAQSFLMAAFITAADAPDTFRFVTAAVGLVTVLVALPAIVAAASNVDVQQQVYFRQIESDERCLVLHGHRRDLGMKPTQEEEKDRLKYGHVLPNMAFRKRSAIRIIYTAMFLASVQILGWVFLLFALMIDEQEQ